MAEEQSTTTSAATGFEEADLITLGQKLASLDLTEPERTALSALITDDDVAGFGRLGKRIDVVGGIRKGMAGLRAGIRAPSSDSGVRAKGVRAAWDPTESIPKPGRI